MSWLLNCVGKVSKTSLKKRTSYSDDEDANDSFVFTAYDKPDQNEPNNNKSTFHTITPKKIYNLGERRCGIRTKTGEQDYTKIRNHFYKKRALFEDPEFPCIDSSLYYSKRPTEYIKWKRPKQIVKNPQFQIEGYSRFNVKQGNLSNCWLVSAVACVTMSTKIFQYVVPPDQDFKNKYAGIFHFRFWQFGKWIDVVVDDRLPTFNGKLKFMRSNNENEFWSSLLEKAYAKLHGSYEALEVGLGCEGMQDFTGGFTELYYLLERPKHFYNIFMTASNRGSLISTYIKENPKIKNVFRENGLVIGHNYSITNAKVVETKKKEKVTLVRLRNPWGDKTKWNGPYSDGSPEWDLLSLDEKEVLEVSFHEDGEFWMSLDDLINSFDFVEICNLTPDSYSAEELEHGHKNMWKMKTIEGEWVEGYTAGGCIENEDLFHCNPQYRLVLKEVDENSTLCTAVITLMQKHIRAQKHKGRTLVYIGMVVLHLPEPELLPEILDAATLDTLRIVAEPTYLPTREITCRLKLPPGTYCIIPSTFDPDISLEFMIRIFSEHSKNTIENEEEVVIKTKSKGSLLSLKKLGRRSKTGSIMNLFTHIGGPDLQTSSAQLKQILEESTKDEPTYIQYSDDMCRSLVASYDPEQTGKIGYQEFETLWDDINVWKEVFQKYDKEGRGSMDSHDFRDALYDIGYHLNNRLLNILGRRHGSTNGRLTFEEYVRCLTKLKGLADVFQQKNTYELGMVSFTFNEWLQNTLNS